MENEKRKEYINHVYSITGLTQVEFSKLIGSVQPAVNKLLNGDRYPTNQHIAHLKAVELIVSKGLLSELKERIVND